MAHLLLRKKRHTFKMPKWNDDRRDEATSVDEWANKQVEELASLMKLWNCYTYTDLYQKYLTEPDSLNGLKWKKMMVNKGIYQRLKYALKRCEMYQYGRRFGDLIDECEDDPINDMTVEESLDLFKRWCNYQDIDYDEFCSTIFAVMDRKTSKRNTVLILGPSNSGKTVMITKPLTRICRHFGQVGNRGNASEFVFMECVDKRMISIDECLMNKDMLEDVKLLFGGEQMRVAVKFEGHAIIKRTPCIVTSNAAPWQLDYSQKTPIVNRCFIYDVKYWDGLIGMKDINPKMWRKIKDDLNLI